MNASIDSDLELEILHHISQSPDRVRQRDLATIVGKSLGMTNAILHRLTEKGMLTVAKVNNRNISYVVTPYGMCQLAGRSYRYFKRTIKNVVDYKDAIEAELCRHLRTLSDTLPAGQPLTLVLIGASDLDFILEHLSQKYHLGWLVVSCGQVPTAFRLSPSAILVLSEDCDSALVVPASSLCIKLSNLITMP